MKSYSVRFYQPEDAHAWNTFVNAAKNATFLFHRDYMDYHNDRFQDCSLIISEGEKWLAVFPAHKVGTGFYSHFGLTYGGLVMHRQIQLTHVIGMMRAIFEFLKSQGFTSMRIKMLPSMYAAIPAEELHYIMSCMQARLYRRDSLSVIPLQQNFRLTKPRKQAANRGIKNRLEIREEYDFEAFWNEILIPNLALKHQAKPVHSLDEMRYLHSKFPTNIRQFNVYHHDKIVAGTTVYITDRVIHPQYISGNADKNKLGSLDFLYRHLMENVFKDHLYFDLGISNEDEGKTVVYGMQYWKQSFDAHTFIQDFYELSLENIQAIDAILK